MKYANKEGDINFMELIQLILVLIFMINSCALNINY